jgi:hypothetical protein
MKKPHAQWLTVHQADIDQDTSIEILWQTAPNTLNLLLFRIDHGGSRPCLVTEEIGPYRSLAELHHKLCLLFGDLTAERVCHPYPWLPPGIPVTLTSCSSTRTLGIALNDRSADHRQSLVNQHNRGIARKGECPALITTPTSNLAID